MKYKKSLIIGGLLVVIALVSGGIVYDEWWPQHKSDTSKVTLQKTALQKVRGYKYMDQLSSAFTPMYSQFFVATVEKSEHSIMEFKKDEWYSVSDEIGYFLNVVHRPNEDQWTIELTKPTALENETIRQFVTLIYGKNHVATVLKQWVMK